jgi:hypothetical protein
MRSWYVLVYRHMCEAKMSFIYYRVNFRVPLTASFLSLHSGLSNGSTSQNSISSSTFLPISDNLDLQSCLLRRVLSPSMQSSEQRAFTAIVKHPHVTLVMDSPKGIVSDICSVGATFRDVLTQVPPVNFLPTHMNGFRPASNHR